MNSMEKFLLECQKGRELIDFRTYFEPEHTFTGFVEKISSPLVCFSKIDNDGDFTGFFLTKIQDIYFLRKASRELRDISKLSQENEATPELQKISLSSFTDAIRDINMTYGYVVVFVEEVDPEVCYIGEVIDIGRFLTLHAFGSGKNAYRSTVIFKTEDISRIEFDGEYEKKLKKDSDNKVIFLR